MIKFIAKYNFSFISFVFRFCYVNKLYKYIRDLLLASLLSYLFVGMENLLCIFKEVGHILLEVNRKYKGTFEK